MESYKIRNDCTNKIIKLLNELGYTWVSVPNDDESSLLKSYWILAESSGDIAYSSSESFYGYASFVEINFDQLQDLVVLRRNDVKDANYKSATDFYYITVENRYYFWNGSSWCLSSADFISGLSPIIDNQINQDPALISGAEALRALADGKEVEFKHDTQGWVTCLGLNIERVLGGWHQMRLKPQTIKLELELPKPFEPNIGDWYFFVSTENDCGYSTDKFEGLDRDVFQTQFGAYRTVNEVKQVVEQLRKIKGAV